MTAFAWTSAFTRPSAPIVSWLFGRSMRPSTVPSIWRSSLPERSPLIVIDLPMFAISSPDREARSGRGGGVHAGAGGGGTNAGSSAVGRGATGPSFFPNKLTGGSKEARILPQRKRVFEHDAAIFEQRALGAVERRHRAVVDA